MLKYNKSQKQVISRFYSINSYPEIRSIERALSSAQLNEEITA